MLCILGPRPPRIYHRSVLSDATNPNPNLVPTSIISYFAVTTTNPNPNAGDLQYYGTKKDPERIKDRSLKNAKKQKPPSAIKPKATGASNVKIQQAQDQPQPQQSPHVQLNKATNGQGEDVDSEQEDHIPISILLRDGASKMKKRKWQESGVLHDPHVPTN